MQNFEMIDPEQATGDLKVIYNEITKSRGKIASVHMIQSQSPSVLKSHMDLYMRTMYERGALRRYQREMIAVVVSFHNNCSYCVAHHSQALNNFWKNTNKVESFSQDWRKVELEEKDVSLCRLAQQITLQPSEGIKELITNLKDHGFHEKAIVDAVNVISYFNYVNRLVLASGISIETDNGSGYNYN